MWKICKKSTWNVFSNICFGVHENFAHGHLVQRYMGDIFHGFRLHGYLCSAQLAGYCVLVTSRFRQFVGIGAILYVLVKTLFKAAKKYFQGHFWQFRILILCTIGSTLHACCFPGLDDSWPFVPSGRHCSSTWPVNHSLKTTNATVAAVSILCR